jgi:hypothetical protein
MVNNEERLDPYGDDSHSQALRLAREARTLTALDEGQAWRRRKDGSLLVARVEVFAAADTEAQRQAWSEHGAACLDALWRQRWRERDREPGWIEARWRAATERPASLIDPGGLDWLTIEDQTGSAETEIVTMYEHLTVWSGRALVTLTIRHRQGEDLDAVAVAAVNTVGRRLATWGL